VHVPWFDFASIRSTLERVPGRNPRMPERRVDPARQVVAPRGRRRRIGRHRTVDRLPRAGAVVSQTDDVTGMTSRTTIKRGDADLAAIVRTRGRIRPRILVAPDVRFIDDLLAALVDADDARVGMRTPASGAGGPRKPDPPLPDPPAG